MVPRAAHRRSDRGPEGRAPLRHWGMANSTANVRVFSDDGMCVYDPAVMRRALEYVKTFDGVIAQHAQEPRLTEGAQMNEGKVSADLGLTGWPAVAEEAIIARDVLLAEHLDSKLHICHLSTKDRGGNPAPPAAHRRDRTHLRPDFQGEPAAAHRRGRHGAASGCC